LRGTRVPRDRVANGGLPSAVIVARALPPAAVDDLERFEARRLLPATDSKRASAAGSTSLSWGWNSAGQAIYLASKVSRVARVRRDRSSTMSHCLIERIEPTTHRRCPTEGARWRDALSHTTSSTPTGERRTVPVADCSHWRRYDRMVGVCALDRGSFVSPMVAPEDVRTSRLHDASLPFETRSGRVRGRRRVRARSRSPVGEGWRGEIGVRVSGEHSQGDTSKFTRGFAGRGRTRDARSHPGNTTPARRPVRPPRSPEPDLAPWTFTIEGRSRTTWTWDEIPLSACAGDIRYVTTSARRQLRGRVGRHTARRPGASDGLHVLAFSHTGYTTNLPLTDVNRRAWVA
jgi:hypothetical protein